MNLLSSEQLGGILSQQLGIPYVNLQGQSQESLHGFPQELIREHEIFPLTKEEGRLFIAMTNPLDRKIIQQVEKVLGCSVEARLTTETDLQTATEKP